MLYGVGDPFICTYVHGVLCLSKIILLLMEESFSSIQNYLIRNELLYIHITVIIVRPITIKYV